MVEENISQELRLKKYRWNKKLFSWRNKTNELMSKKHIKICTTLNYIEQFFILSFTITRCISIFAFASLIGILIGCFGILGFLQSD